VATARDDAPSMCRASALAATVPEPSTVRPYRTDLVVTGTERRLLLCVCASTIAASEGTQDEQREEAARWPT
jgi:hypothetical protein